MLAVKDLLSFFAGFGVGLGVSVLAAQNAGLTTRKRLAGRAVISAQTAAVADFLAEEYAGHSATDEGMAEGPVEERQNNSGVSGSSRRPLDSPLANAR